MAYKINIRNSSNTAWINLLEAQYIPVADTNGYYTSTDLEAALAEIFTGKAARVAAATDPTVNDDSYLPGTVWVNTTTDTAFIMTSNVATSASWVDVGAVDTEIVQDIVGAMIGNGTQSNVSVTYDDNDGSIDFSVAAATTSSLGVASFGSTYFGVNAGAVSIASGAITATELAENIDASAMSFNAATVAGSAPNDLGTGTTDLWSATKIAEYTGALVTGLDWQESVLSKVYEAPPTTVLGDRYIAGPSASGAWAGHANEIAEYDGADWQFAALSEGQATWVEDEDVQYVWNGVAWVKVGSTVTHANLLGLTADDHPQYVSTTVDRTVTSTITFNPSVSGAPFVLGSNAQGQLVTGLNAEFLDGQSWNVAATASPPAVPAANDVWLEITA